MFTHSFSHPLRAIAVLGAATALAGTGVAVAADNPTQVTVDPPTTLRAGAVSPIDAPGVKAIRRGKKIPAGYVLVGQRVTIEPGTHLAGAALRFHAPGSTRLRTFGTVGHIDFVSTRAYVGKKETSILSFPGTRTGQSVGTVYAVSR